MDMLFPYIDENTNAVVQQKMTPNQVPLTPGQVAQTYALLSAEMSVPLEQEHAMAVRRTLVALHYGMRTAAYTVVYFRKMCRRSPQETRGIMTSAVWMLAAVVCAIIADKMVDDAFLTMGEWAEFLGIEADKLCEVERQMLGRMARLGMLHVTGAEVARVMAEIDPTSPLLVD